MIRVTVVNNLGPFFYQSAIGKNDNKYNPQHGGEVQTLRLLRCICYQRLLISEIMRNQWQNAHMCFLVHDVNNMGINKQLHTG